MRRITVWFVLVALILSMGGCQLLGNNGEDPMNGSGETLPSNESSLEASTGRIEEILTEDRALPVTEFTIGILIPDSLLPWEVTEKETADMLMLVEEPLWNVTETKELSFCLAESAKMSSDGSYADITLKDNIVFQNGHKLTNEDVIYSLQKLMETTNAFSSSVETVSSVTARGTKGIRITFKEKGYLNLEKLVFPIVPKDYKEALVPMGTGPYGFEKLEPEREMMLSASASYRGIAPKIASVRIFFVRDKDALPQCFESGRTNLFHPEDLDWGRMLNRQDRKIHDTLSEEAVYLVFHEEGNFAKTLSNRQKLVMGLDAGKMLQLGFWGRGEVSSLPLSPLSWYTEGLEAAYTYDPERAANMETVGYSTLLVSYDPQDPILELVMSEMTTELEKVGLSIRIVTQGDPCDVTLCRGQLSVVESAALFGLEDRLNGLSSKAKIQDLAKEMNDKILTELPLFPLFYLKDGVITGYGIEGELTIGACHPYLGLELLEQEEKEP